ncbi:MAG: hypothetical protein H0V76_07240, partial [Blastocatellia bacterium]|nr:hypothetical protein [Blastocatellia bacterium]
MKRSVQVLTLSLCFVLSALGQADTRVSATWQVVKYDIVATLSPSEAERTLGARARLDVKNISPRPASSLTLRISTNADVSAVRVNDAAADFTKRQEKLGTSDLQALAIRIAPVPAGGNLSVVVEYRLRVAENSGLGMIGPGNAQFLPLSFWYPTPNSWYFARGADYAPFRVQVGGGSAGSTIISAGAAGPMAFETPLNGQPFFLLGNWEKTESNGVEVYIPGGTGGDAAIRAAELALYAAEVSAHAAKILGDSTSFPLRIAGVRRGGGFANAGVILVDDGYFRRGRMDSQTAMSVAESIVRFRLGGTTVVTDDGAGAIKEGLARFIATQFVGQKFGKDVADIERMRQRAAYAGVAQRDAPITMAAPLDDYYFSTVGNKGAMVWRILAGRIGEERLFQIVRGALQDDRVTLADLRRAMAEHKELADHLFDQVTDANLLVGLPQTSGGETRVAVRNTGGIPVTVDVRATLANGEFINVPATIAARSFGEVAFRAPAAVTKVEIDPEKLYPQTDYSDDIAPRETTESDPLLFVKREFDRQEWVEAEKNARTVLRQWPRFDDVRIFLARSLLAQNKMTEAEREFRVVLDEKLPTARSIAWATVGLAEGAAKAGQNADAIRHATEAIRFEADYGASLAARNLRRRLNAPAGADESVRTFFAQFDKAAMSNRKADMEGMAAPGEATRFVAGVSGQTTQWTTQVLYVDQLDPINV